jgi:hypothetical protein
LRQLPDLLLERHLFQKRINAFFDGGIRQRRMGDGSGMACAFGRLGKCRFGQL